MFPRWLTCSPRGEHYYVAMALDPDVRGSSWSVILVVGWDANRMVKGWKISNDTAGSAPLIGSD